MPKVKKMKNNGRRGRLGVILAFLSSALTLQVNARVYNGLEVFLHKYTGIVKGKRVGLITNPTGVDAHLRSTADLLKANPAVNLVALFAPEHGIRGDIPAGQDFQCTYDRGTGLPVYSLYGGRDHRPPPGSLDKVDMLIYSIQDIGCRSYTYIWHLAECMSAAGLAGKPVMVLDVPNPLGAVQIDGPIMENRYRSFIGLYPIPYVYGLTVGELALYFKRVIGLKCQLYVVPMMNYRRGMSWRQTGLPWVPTSPQIPSPESACCYAVTGAIGTLGTVGIGIGYTLPFQVVAAPGIDAAHMTRSLNRLGLTGIRFREIHFTPSFGLFKGQKTNGVQLHVTDVSVFKPTTCTVAILHYLQHYCPEFKWRRDRIEGFDKAMGTAEVRRLLQQGYSFQTIVKTWQNNLQNYSAALQKHRIKIYK
ncbi:MAG: DUF1343 domain-containing protein [Victivallaceae bacterium]|nr:DUF1343 domain-containing protein [Victivallaceae bacterium]